MRNTLFAGALLLAVPAIAFAAPDSSAAPAKPKKICKVDQDDSISRIRKTTCKTAEEWQADKEAKSSEVRDFGGLRTH